MKTTFFKGDSNSDSTRKIPYAHKLVKILLLWSQLPDFQIAGRLKHFLKRGNSNKGSEYFRNCEGISIPFLPQPLQQQLPKEINLTLKEKSVVTEEIGDFLKKVHME